MFAERLRASGWRRGIAGDELPVLSALATAAAILLTGCGSSAASAGPAPASTTASTPAAKTNPLARVVFLGDSLTAGFQNGSLLDTQQPHGFANLIAAQAGFAITMPLIAPPGEPAVLTLVSDDGLLPVLGQASGASIGRDNPDAQPTDLGVPGYTLDDLIHAAPIDSPAGEPDTFTQLVLGYPVGNTRTELQQAAALEPSTIFLWIGSNDALAADVSGSPGTMTPLASFASDYALILKTLTASTSAHLVVANIPDVTAVPYLTPAASVLAVVAWATGLTQEEAGRQLGLSAGDLVTLTGLVAVESAVNAYKPGGVLPALTDADVLNASEILTVQSLINSYNQVIAQQVAAAGGTLVDMHAYYATLGGGLTINGVHATSAYLGGLFGLDGVHPTNTGYALIANEFIAAVNTAYHLSIGAVNVAQVAASDPYFGANIKPGGSVRIRLRAARQGGPYTKGKARPDERPGAARGPV